MGAYKVVFEDEVSKFFDDSSKADGKPRLVLITGSPAAGKTTLRKLHFSKGYVLLDAGEIFLNLSRGGHYDFPGAFREPLDIIGHLVAERAITERRNIVTEMIGGNEQSLKTILEALSALGYETEGQFVRCDAAERIRRNENRGPDNISAYYTEPFHERWLLQAVGSRTEPGTNQEKLPPGVATFTSLVLGDGDCEIMVGGRLTTMNKMEEEGIERAHAETERELDDDIKALGLERGLDGGEWDEDRFTEKLRREKGDEIVQTAITLLRWLEDKGYSIYWAQAGKVGIFSAYINTASEEIMPITVTAYGFLDINLAHLKHRAEAFADPAKRLELRDRLKIIKGVSVGSTEASVSLSFLQEERTRDQLLQVLDWLFGQISR